jgi:FkbM family methyltransferase
MDDRSLKDDFKKYAKKMLNKYFPSQYTSWKQHYPGYTNDDLKVFDRFRDIPGNPEPGFLKDYLGVRTRPEMVPEFVRHLAGIHQGIPVPEDWNAEAPEHIGLLKSVLDASNNYSIMELGASWGDWMVAGAAAARHLGIKEIHMLGVDPDAGHFGSIHTHLIDNGFNPEEHVLLNAAVGSKSGRAFFPKVKNFAEHTGGIPVLPEELTGMEPKEMCEIDIISINDLLAKQTEWDLVHMDVQGWEYSICVAGIGEMNAHVKRVVIGTHSRKLEGDLLSLFHSSGWILENEKPVQFSYNSGIKKLEQMTKVDGVQVWRNPSIKS